MMISKYVKLGLVYGLIIAAGLAVGWGAPRVYMAFKPAFSEGDYSAHYIGRETDVVVYGTATCPYCAKTRAYLLEHHINFADLDVNTDEKARVAFAQLGAKSVPIILIGKRRLDGFSPTALQSALDAAGHSPPR
jgi:glutaredoxin